MKFLLYVCLSLSNSHSYGQVTDNYAAKIDSLMQTASPRAFNGVILITQNGKIKYSKAHGYSNFEDKTPITIKDNFRIQSNSKQITAVLILKEVENGRIDLNSPIKKYLPELKQTWADTVTVHQLLNMSSGITSLDKPLIFEPGTGFHYSNPAYSLLGRLVENVSGDKYIDLANGLFENLGMHNSFCYEIDKPNTGLISGYTNSTDEYNLFDFNTTGFTKETWKGFIPAGGIVSNVNDLNIWDTKLHNGEILRPETYGAMVTSNVEDFDETFSDKKKYYGYGVNISGNDPIKYIGHAGRGLGFVSLKFYVPEKGLDVIVLENVYNRDTDIIYHFEKEIRRIVLNSNLIK
ncbi:serine hydrolase domain-containing protein [Parapedobacter tibetensis]|uniref:serine hydrolase domain-containing protein n=1 Tax=Parapedobacter tibetensis TaxID=2972951 RepID=UPI002152C7FF|nr:serine hydrolase domain-containing protein [Parapedobacter tibetensis]